MKPITKAIIPVAGWGTRMLPITKTIEKCMLPIGTRPLIDYVVQDCLAAGINEFIFIVSENSSQLEDFYRSNIQLNDYLKRKGKEDLLPMIAPLKAKMHFVTQPSYGKYGTAVPVALAADYIDDDESAVVLMGDDFIYNSDGSSEITRLVQATPSGECSLLAVEIDPLEVSKYGVIEIDGLGNYQKIIEKPTASEAPSSLINTSKYILTKKVIQMCAEVKISSRGEYEITDAINQYVNEGGIVKVVAAQGQYLDGGTPEGWLRANSVVCKN